MISETGVDPLAPTRLTGWQWVRLVGNILNLTTLLGLGFAAIGRARVRRGPRGLLLAEGYRLPFPVAGAFTVGSVITTPTTFAERLRGLPHLLDHEERHTWQYLYCLGLPFYIAYVVMMGWSVLRTGDRVRWREDGSWKAAVDVRWLAGAQRVAVVGGILVPRWALDAVAAYIESVA